LFSGGTGSFIWLQPNGAFPQNCKNKNLAAMPNTVKNAGNVEDQQVTAESSLGSTAAGHSSV